MISDLTYFDANNSLEIQGIQNLKGRSRINDPQTRHQVAGQFESMLVHLLIKNMREASRSLTQDDEKSDQSGLYQDLFDNQVALLASQQGFGFSKQIEEYLMRVTPQAVDHETPQTDASPSTLFSVSISPEANRLKIAPPEKHVSEQEKNSAEVDVASDFIQGIWHYAKTAANTLGVDPKLLIAQIALETGWGKRIIAKSQESTHNLFNMKAGKDWSKDAVVVDCLEARDGIFVKEQAAFKRYDSFEESFSDYVRLIQNNVRYREAVESAADPKRYMDSLQQAQYATDPHYAQKVMAIYQGDRLKTLLKNSLGI